MMNCPQGIMRKQLYSQCSSAGEPQIIVEESIIGEEEAEFKRDESPPRCLDPDSPSLNPYLLSPWRETRKHSLPTPQCTSGITASQVRRLSERGGEGGSGPSPREAAFLATLSQAPAPQPGGRRHSVVTISKVPTTLFGRNRRESIAAFPMGATRILPSRRDSSSGLGGPPSNSGSTHNLQLDIMDDITEIKSRKVRLKMWKTPSRERICEIQPLEGSSSTQRYIQQQRRYSDFAALSSAPNSSSLLKRRASEYPKPSTSGIAPEIINSNTDLISILSSLTSSATEIDRCGDEKVMRDDSKNAKNSEQKCQQLKGFRSNSFDVSALYETGNKKIRGLMKNSNTNEQSAFSWFTNRHQPISQKQKNMDTTFSLLSSKLDKLNVIKAMRETFVKPTKKESSRHMWDDTSNTKLDAQMLGSAIEEFLTSQRRSDIDTRSKSSSKSSPIKQKTGKITNWFAGRTKEKEESTETHEASVCSSLKDLFVK